MVGVVAVTSFAVVAVVVVCRDVIRRRSRVEFQNTGGSLQRLSTPSISSSSPTLILSRQYLPLPGVLATISTKRNQPVLGHCTISFLVGSNYEHTTAQRQKRRELQRAGFGPSAITRVLHPP